MAHNHMLMVGVAAVEVVHLLDVVLRLLVHVVTWVMQPMVMMMFWQSPSSADRKSVV